MTDISWSSFDGTKFQDFGNALLHFEVSKHATLFSAPGQDDGVDQLYEGSYEGEDGIWRFQDKFHNSGTKTNDVAAFKRDIIRDINENNEGETKLVFVTNLNLTKKKYQEILTAGKEELWKLGRTDCEVKIWHFPKIQTLLIEHPVVRNWFWNDQTTLLQSYDEYFKTQLSADKGYFTNVFFGRSTEFEQLSEFLIDPAVAGLSLIANTGYGKTRLIIEFLKSSNFNNTDFRALVLNHTGFDPAQMQNLLKCKTKYLLIIDDSHKIPKVTQEVIRQIGNSAGQHKYLLTTRPSTVGTITEALPSHADTLNKFTLNNLRPAETREMLNNELPWLPAIQISSLADKSKGIPSIILAMNSLVRAGRQPSEISAEAAFIQSVNQIMNEAQIHILSTLTIPRQKSERLIRLLALLGPLKSNQKDIEFLAGMIESKDFEVRQLLNELKKLAILQYSSTISLRPEPYSEALVSQELERNNGFIKFVIESDKSSLYKTNILKNLLQSENNNSGHIPLINDLLEEYIDSLNNLPVQPQTTVALFKFLEEIAVKRPSLCFRAVRQFINLPKDVTQLIHNPTETLSNRTYFEQIISSIEKLIIAISIYSEYSRNNLEETYELVMDISAISDDANLFIDCYCYQQWDFKEHTPKASRCCERQIFLKNKICGDLQNKDADLQKLENAIAGTKILLNLEFSLEEYFERDTMTMHFGSGTVPYCTHIRQIRMQVLKSIMHCLLNMADSEVRVRLLNILLKHHYYSTNHFKENGRFDLKEEVKTVFNFLNEILNKTVSTYEKTLILNTIQRETRSDVDEIFQPVLAEVRRKAFLSSTVEEALEKELLNQDYKDIRLNQDKRFERLISKCGSIENFGALMLKVKSRLDTVKDRSNYIHLLKYIGTKYPYAIKKIFTEIQNNFPGLVNDSITMIRYLKKDENYFESILQWLWVRKDIYMNSFYWLLTFGKDGDSTTYKLADLKYYEYAVENVDIDPNMFHYIQYHIMEYAYLDKVKVFNLIDKLFKILPDDKNEDLSYILFEKGENYSQDFKNEILQLYKDNASIIDLSKFKNNQYLRFVDSCFGFEKLYEILEEFITRALLSPRSWEYQLERFQYNNDEIATDEKIARYFFVVRKYLSDDNKHPKKYRSLFSIFRPDINLTEGIADEFRKLFDTYDNNEALLYLLARPIQSFHNRSKTWLYLMKDLGQKVIKLSGDEGSGKLKSLFGTDFCHNTGTRSKSGTGPYPEDVYRKNLLDEILSDPELHPHFVLLFTEVKLRVEQEIKNEIDRDVIEIGW